MMAVARLLAASLMTLALAGCVVQDDSQTPASASDEGALVPPGSHPAYGYEVYLHPGMEPTHDRGHPAMRALPAEISGLRSEKALVDVPSGNGIAVFGNTAFVGAGGGPMFVVDVTDPPNARVVSQVDAPARDIDTIAYPDGRLVAVSTGGSNEMYAVDVTDPANAQLLAAWTTEHGSHNLAVVPGTPIVYNSPSAGTMTDIFDLSDPEEPKLVNDWDNGHACHDLMFYNDVINGKFRAYCAGLDVTQIWDTTDPVHPTIIVEMPFPPEGDPQGLISHMAMPNVDATVLVVGDETSGRCDVENLVDGTPAEDIVPKHTNVWFYDISDEKKPVVHGKVTPDIENRACINHFGRLIADREQIVISYYSDGIMVIDFEDIDQPYIVSKYATARGTWDAWYYQGYVFTGGGNAGMEVLSFT